MVPKVFEPLKFGCRPDQIAAVWSLLFIFLFLTKFFIERKISEDRKFSRNDRVEDISEGRDQTMIFDGVPNYLSLSNYLRAVR